MATGREGNKAVLLLVGVMSKSWDALQIIKNVSRVVERARAQKQKKAKGSEARRVIVIQC